MARSVKLIAARRMAGMTRAEAAKKLGISSFMLGHYEKYEQIVPLDVANEMVRLYRLPAKYLDFGCDIQLLTASFMPLGYPPQV